MARSWWRRLAAIMALALVATACGGDDEGGGDFKAAFIMVAPVGDAGWNFMHDQGRQQAEAATGVETAFVEAIPEGGAEFDDAVQQFTAT